MCGRHISRWLTKTPIHPFSAQDLTLTSDTSKESVRSDVSFSISLQLSPECVAAAEGVDLIVVEGMGRAIETNLNATFSCDSLKLAMVKHPEVCYACAVMCYPMLTLTLMLYHAEAQQMPFANLHSSQEPTLLSTSECWLCKFAGIFFVP